MTDIHAMRLYDTPSSREKEAERQQLAADMAAFEAAGGKVQTLGDTPISHTSISRRQVVEGGIEGRSTKRGKKA